MHLSTEAHMSALSNEDHTNFVIESLELAVKCCGEPRFSPIFLQYYKLLILKTIPNCLHLTESDKEMVEDSPNEFTDLGLDICEKQESETVKTNAAKLLEMLCDNIDGALTFVVTVACTVIEGTLKGLGLPEDLSYYAVLDQEVKMDLCLILLSIVNYSISRRKDLLGMLDTLFSINFDVLVAANSAIIQSRLGLFLYFYAEHIHLNDETQIAKWIWFLISCMAPNYPFKAGVIQACETLSAICQDEEVMLRIHPYIPEIFKRITLCITNQREKNFFEALLELMNWYTQISNDEIMALVSMLVQKIQIEVGNRGNKESSILIQKCWNIIRNVTNSEFLNSDKTVRDI